LSLIVKSDPARHLMDNDARYWQLVFRNEADVACTALEDIHRTLTRHGGNLAKKGSICARRSDLRTTT
jgi:hypothetical protein